MKTHVSKTGFNKVRIKDRNARGPRNQLKFITDVRHKIRTYTFFGNKLWLGHLLKQVINYVIK